jgi:molecular chaperone GrpE
MPSDARPPVEQEPGPQDAARAARSAKPAEQPAEQAVASPAGTPRVDDGRAATAAVAAEEGEDRAGPDADESALQGDLDELVAVAAQRDEYLALAQRTQADFENYRKRVGRESVAAQERGLIKLAQELLPALDNLDRALEKAGAGGEGEGREEALLEGVGLVRSELHAALARVGIERFAPQGEKFDPAQHEAMAQQPVAGAPSGTVAEVFQPGYRCGDTIIRPARVLVAA